MIGHSLSHITRCSRQGGHSCSQEATGRQAKHVAVIEFLRAELSGEIDENLLFQFGKMRKKRHNAMYEQAEIISRKEAETAITAAKRFLSAAEKLVGEGL